MKQAFGLWIIMFILVHPARTNASSLGVWPINPRIDAPASSTLVWVKNNNKNNSVLLQARVFLWQQVNNKDELVPQDDLVVSPPMIEVKADAQQVFRVMNRKGVIQNSDEEKSYRVLIDEVPGEARAQDSLLRFQMRYSLPLFVGLPDNLTKLTASDRLKKIAPGLSYRVVQAPEPLIEIYNKNLVHVRLSKVAIANLQTPQKSLIISEGLLGYILPKTSRQWPLTAAQLNAINQEGTVIKFEQEHQELIIVSEK